MISAERLDAINAANTGRLIRQVLQYKARSVWPLWAVDVEDMESGEISRFRGETLDEALVATSLVVPP